MKGLAAIPNLEALSVAYAELQANAGSLGEARIAELANWSRFDPRLLEQLIAHLARHWKELSPVVLNAATRASAWPAALGVALEQTGIVLGSEGRGELFRGWKACALAQLPASEGGLFFIGIAPFGGRMARREAGAAVSPYLRWGYLWSELQLPGKFPTARALPRASRENIARELLARSERFSIGDYLAACGGLLGRRQAERDLGEFGFLRARGATKARVYSRRGRLKQ